MPSVIVFRFFLFFGFILFIDISACFCLNSFSREWKNIKTRRLIINLPWIISALLFLYAIITILAVSNTQFDYVKTRHYFNIIGIIFIIIFLKTILILFKLMERVLYISIYIIHKSVFRRKPFNNLRIKRNTSNVFFKTGLVTVFLFLFLLIYGMIWGKYNFEIEKHEIAFKNLPKSFDGLKIVQISDTHLGSFPDTSHLSKAINLIINQNPDFIFFTGDLINNEAIEANDYIPMFRKLIAKYGKFAILGNHDMGDYRRWYTESDKINDYNQIVKVYEQMGFRVLIDESCYTKINNDSIAIIGVKSWSLPPFRKYGNLKKAMTGVPDAIFKILLTHNPHHWNKEVEGKLNIDLTLAGHTHGMQIGFYNKFFKWSPIQYFYSNWGGLYKEGEQYINVNKGLGFLGIPIRLGINPEITVIILKKL